ncbi:spirocyclase AveC family protein [Paraconexibacter algicola]|uniref:Spirocyclase, AveC family n=1 Tax=Paraconexibacter algicola TaxID=2133960 RepID=A0A2T4UL54_9ACTN|nr:spirocyclase AveC family protein [Paraconexibacter algicola]PTL59951.1 hypothetical protein C7Y72_09990 [Paraconexibacter algicola]
MATVSEPPVMSSPELARGRRFGHIHVWGAIGFVSVAFIVVVMAQWVADGLFTYGTGSDDFSTGRLVVLRLVEFSQFLALLVLLAYFVVRPLLARRRLHFDGLLLLAVLLLNFWDPLDNYLNFAFQYNAHLIHVNSWGHYFPGWASGPDVWVIPVFFILGAYTWAFFGAARMGSRALDWLTVRWPERGTATKLLVVWALCALLVAVSELIYLQSYSFGNLATPDALTVWADRFYGWPVYNPIFFALPWVALAWLRWGRDADGLSFVERGASPSFVEGRPHLWALCRFMAIFAYAQVTYMLLYFLPWNLLTTFAEAPPSTPSYLPLP